MIDLSFVLPMEGPFAQQEWKSPLLELAAAARAYGRPIEIHTLGESSPTVVTSGESSSDDAEGATPKSPVAPVFKTCVLMC